MIKELDWFFENLKNKKNFCYVRFNDGEMMGIESIGSVVARGDQVVDASLNKALTEAIKHRQKNYYIGVPCSLCYPKHRKLSEEIIGEYDLITSAVLLTNRNWKEFHDRFPVAMKKRELIWVGGKDQDPEKLKEYGLNVVNTIRVHNRESWKYYDRLEEMLPQFIKKDTVVGISLGPTARVLCRKLFEKYPDATFLDMGSLLDPITRGVYLSPHKGWEETGFNIQMRCEECN